MARIDTEAVDKMLCIGLDLMHEGFKLGGELAKETLLLVLEKTKETKENKAGLTSIKKMLNSKEELNVINLKKEHLADFRKLARGLGMGFAIVKDKNSDYVKIIYKTKDASLMKNVMEDILDKTKERFNDVKEKYDNMRDKNIYEFFDNFDFKQYDENCYRHEVDNVDKAKAFVLRELLKVNDVEAELVVNKALDNRMNVVFKVDEKDKDKTVNIINSNKDKTVEDIVEEINSIKKAKKAKEEENQEQANQNQQQKEEKETEKKSRRKVPLEEQIEEVDNELKANAERKKSKTKANKKER